MVLLSVFCRIMFVSIFRPRLVNDCQAAFEKLRGRGVELTQEPIPRYGSVDANFRDPSGNGWKLVQAR